MNSAVFAFLIAILPSAQEHTVASNGVPVEVRGDEFDASKSVVGPLREPSNSYSFRALASNGKDGQAVVAVLVHLNLVRAQEIDSGSFAFATFKGGDKATATSGELVSRGCFSAGCGWRQDVIVSLSSPDIKLHTDPNGELAFKVLLTSGISYVVKMPRSDIVAVREVVSRMK